MSILNSNLQPQISETERAARQVKASAKNLADQLIRNWNSGWDLIWNNSDPAAVLAELGTDAGELFALNEALVTFMNTELAGKRQEDLDAINAKVAAKPATTTAQDGSVTID